MAGGLTITRRATLYDVAVIGDHLTMSWQFSVMFKDLLHVGYPKMIVRCLTTSRTTSCDVEAHHTIFV